MATVLVIEDDTMVRETIQALLESDGYEVALAGDGDVGLAMFARQRPDLVVTDIIMPVKEGIETIRALRRLDADVPILAVSGGGRMRNLDFLAVARSFGANATLAKPFEADEFLKTVAGLLART